MNRFLRKFICSISRPFWVCPTFENTMTKFFARLSYNPTEGFYTQGCECEDEVRSVFEHQNLSQEEFRQISQYIPGGCDAANFMYHQSPLEVKVYVAVYTILFLYFDDTQSSNVCKLQGFAQAFGEGTSHGDPHYDHFARLLTSETPKIFDPYATSCIIRSSLDMVNACGLEFQFPEGFSRMTSEFPSWLRRRTGNGEAYAWFNFPKSKFPEDKWLGRYVTAIHGIAEFVDTTNDILSFYKELVIDKEPNNYFSNQAKVHGCTELEALASSCKRMDIVNRDIKWVLCPYPDLLQVYEGFREGYIMFHCAYRRYKLSEASIGVKERNLEAEQNYNLSL